MGHREVDLPTVALVGVVAVNTAEPELAVTFRDLRLSQPDGSQARPPRPRLPTPTVHGVGPWSPPTP